MAQSVFERKEIKYLLSDEQYRAFLERIRGMAKVDEYGQTSILNIYFDTPDYRLIRTSLEKPEYKEKLRLRTYGTPDDDTAAFIEIKKKYAGIVYKRRETVTYRQALDYLCCDGPAPKQTQVFAEIDYMRQLYGRLVPAMAISYERIAMCGTADPELRITFDTDIRWRTTRLDLIYGNTGTDIICPGQHLMELKITGAMPLPLAAILSELKIYPLSFSKYGRGYTQMLGRTSAAGRIIPMPAYAPRRYAYA